MARILVIDDEESIRFTFKTFLTKEGHEILTAEDYPSAMRQLNSIQPDIVFVDIILPQGKTGLDILKEIRSKNMQCPVIIMTGQPGVETAAEAVRQGAFDYVPKPIKKETLFNLTRSAIKFYSLIKDKQKIEREKERYQLHLEATFESVRDIIVTVDEQMRITAANSMVDKLCDITSHAILGQRFDAIDSPCLQLCHENLTKALNDRVSIKDFQIECRNTKKQAVILTGNICPLIDKTHRFLGAVLVLRDITRLSRLERELDARTEFHGIIGKSIKMQRIYNLLEDLCKTDTTVLITGESGTGKELLAKAIHQSSNRASGPLIKVNCPALPETLLESELFGHRKGAFTNALSDKKGRFELAHKGTLFLDEIADISLTVQSKLLRALQEKEIERLGDTQTIDIDTRVIAATNQNLKQKIDIGQFRQDLYYRLKVFEIELPPLREKREDIPLLVNFFIDSFNRSFQTQVENISDNVLKIFMKYSWPGNIRELKHSLEHAFVLCRDRIIRTKDLPDELKSPSYSKSLLKEIDMKDEQNQILEALKQSGGNKAKAARLLGVSRQTIYRKLAVFNIKNPL